MFLFCMKEKTPLSMAHQLQHSMAESDDQKIPPSQALKLKKPHQAKVTKMGKEDKNKSRGDKDKDHNFNAIRPTPTASASKVHNKVEIALNVASEEEDSGRERLKRHRVEVAGRVWIPEIWGQEELLKDWIDCTAFDAPLVPSTILMARAALVEEGTRATTGGFTIENRC
ncbi:hypothetical protein VNO77_15944 [Canavalia gladiata]|uniref:Protein BIC1-like n=1 Tax=Canavalia gladiata TaxID=3824 RepID=A0AAN9M038_CANGL